MAVGEESTGAYQDFCPWPGEEAMQPDLPPPRARRIAARLGFRTPFASDTPRSLAPAENPLEEPLPSASDDEPGLFPTSYAKSKAMYTTPPRSSSPTPPPPTSNSVRVDIPECLLLTPRSCYEPFEPPDGVSIMSERSAVKMLSTTWGQTKDETSDDAFVEFHLNDFAVYCDTEKFPEEMRSLHHLDTKTGHSNFFVDGVLSVGESKAYVRRVPIVAVPIDNYETLSVHTVRGHVWVQSAFNVSREIHYRLGQPAKEYARFFSRFLWVADLAKHFVDYLKVMGDNNREVTIYHFRSTFATWVHKVHQKAPEFLEWQAQHPSNDYRTSVVANIAFLHKEAIGVLGNESTYFHTIWSEAWEFQRFPEPPKSVANPPTVVTQYIYDCFKHLPFGDRLEAVPLSPETKRLRNSLIRQRHLELPSSLHDSTKNISIAPEQRIKNIKPGDTISTLRDAEESGTKWKREVSKGVSDADRWFALVQKVHIKRNGKRVFDVIWYYQPVDTLCSLMKYPWNNELFLSDHCSCSEKAKIKDSEVLGVHVVDFGGTSATSAELFCRQTYLQGERRWITLKPGHLRCRHTQPSSSLKGLAPKYRPGDTLLLHLDLKSPFSEPCELITSFREEGKKFYRFRRLTRRKAVDPTAPTARPNEVVYSGQLVEVKVTRILGPCYVRFFQTSDRIPTPYDRDGVGNFFYITHREVFDHAGVASYVPLEEAPPSLCQGYDPDEKVPKLRGMDLFCGGGNFGRGLEDGGGIEMNWINDFNSKAIHSYMANVKSPDAVHPFLGSIDDLQRQAIQGQFADNVPHIGDIDFIAGGSPCPGFSCLTNDKTTIAQRKNQSLVAAFASFVDLYRPKYGILENVPGIIQKKSNRDQDVFSQLVCALVGLGYQTQLFFLDASSCGSPQRRSRVFFVFAAPGFELPQKPPQTHSHPPNTRTLSIGSLPNGQSMAARGMPVATPFKYVSAEEAISDLPSVYDAKPDICVPYPDHRVSLGLTKMLRARISFIPTQPWGMNFARAWYGEDKKAGSGVLTAAERALFPGADAAMDATSQPVSVLPARISSKAYGRLFPHRLMETIVTRQSPGDAKNGRQLHWRENRVMTVMEARRAQGLRDEEVLLGDPSTQYRIVGNSVAREPAVALGVVIREAWVTSLRRNDKEKALVRAVGSEMRGDNGLATPPAMNVDDTNSDLLGDDMAFLIDRYAMPVPVTTAARDSPSVASTATMINSSAAFEGADSPVSRKRPTSRNSLVVEIPSKRQKTGADERSCWRGGSGGTPSSSLGRDVILIDDDDDDD